MVPQRGARRHRRGAGRALYDAAMLPPSPAPPRPDFRAPAFLRAHLADIMAFYAGRCADASGGLYHFFKDDGTVYDARTATWSAAPATSSPTRSTGATSATRRRAIWRATRSPS